MTSDSNGQSEYVEIGIFDIADWFWAFRWLAAALVLCAVIWTAALFWTAGPIAPMATTHDVTITIYPSGTPVRGAADISGIIYTQLQSLNLPTSTAIGSNPISVNVSDEQAVLAITARMNELEEDLRLDVETQNEALANLVTNENASEFVSAQYVRNISFLDGAQSGLIRVLNVSSRAISSSSSSSSLTRLLTPWIASGAVFFVVTGGLTFIKSWQAHRRRKIQR